MDFEPPIKRIFLALENPIMLKDFKWRMRGKLGFGMVAGYVALLSLFVWLAYLWMRSEGFLDDASPGVLYAAGKMLFASASLSELLLIMFIAPALTSGAIAAERERLTFDLLRLSTLSPRALLLGKLGSALAYILLLAITAVPLQSLAFVLGGVELPELLISLLTLALSALLFSALGLYFSAVARRVLVSNFLSYSAVILPVALLFAFFFWLFQGDFDLSAQAERVMVLWSWTLASSNPIFAWLISEIMLSEEQEYFLFFAPANPPLALFSPWILYAVYALTLSAAMLTLSAFYLKRYEY